MDKKQEVAAYEPVDLTDDAGFMDTGVLYADKEPAKEKGRKDDVDGEGDSPGSV